MDNEIYIKRADLISDELISLWKNNKTKKKKFIDLYNELLTEEDKEIQYIILTYVPERLSVKGYEIVNSEFFELEKY